jgi:pyruvate dehydrogenase E2 component (dihydrolipoamide acetyltransferase)
MTLPDLSTTGGSVRIVRWLAAEGQVVKRGQPLLEVETDKATMEVEAYLSGILLEIKAADGADVEVGQPIAVISSEEESRLAPEPVPPGTDDQPAAPASPARTGMFARNRQKAAQEPVLPNAVPASAQGPSPAPNLAPELTQSSAQRVVAQRMLESKQTIPHFYLQTSANAGPAVRRRNAAPGAKPAWDAFFVYAAGKALKKYPRLCASFISGKLRPQGEDAVGIAVDLEGDLYVCRIADPAQKTPEIIATEIESWVQRLRAGDPTARKVQPGNLTVTNLGAAGVESFTAVINPPEAAILAVGKIGPVVAALDGQMVIQERVTLTLSVDHRVVNGRYAAEFLAEIVREFEGL